ncbi:uncharacterized protein [Arachis hypogaea]|uniref:uncharacterized protein n=1 Tax=Arachis hypogaea TaxID=3818 RepID=UPI000DEDB8C1|nr:uncharacterized protein LOC112770013 [Arachis hypogaea]
MTTAMDMVNKINPEKEAWNLKVRVIRLWTVPTFTDVFLLTFFISRFKQLLSKGRVYVMKLFSVVPNQGSYRATRHLIFQFRTTVSNAICDFIPKSALTISPFTELLETKEDSDFLVDVVGLLVSVPEEKEYDKDGKKMKMAVTELAENDHRIWCALFGEYVDELNRFLSSGYAEQPVVVLQLAKVRVLEVELDFRMLCLHQSLDLILTSQSSIPHGVGASQPIGIVGSEKNIGIEEDFMKLTPRCTVKSLDDNNRAGTFVVLTKIAEIVEDGPWWYSACVCGRSVQAESGIYFCQFCNIHVTNVTPRFRVKMLVEDSTGLSIFVLFDREASYLLNKTCAQLFEQHLKDVDVVFGIQSPPIFEEIVGKTMLFKVLNRPVGMEKFKGTYPVRRVCDDAAIVGMFELSGSDLSSEKCVLV